MGVAAITSEIQARQWLKTGFGVEIELKKDPSEYKNGLLMRHWAKGLMRVRLLGEELEVS